MNPETTQSDSDDSVDTLDNFDPKHEKAKGMSQARIKGVYDKLVNRGEEERAEEIRQAPPHKRKPLVKDVKEFDVEYDQPTNSAKVRIKICYDKLLEIAEEEDNARAESARKAAEDLRASPSVRKQKERVGPLSNEFDFVVFG